MKICKKCNTLKDNLFFYKDKSKKDGYRNSCIECDKIYSDMNKERRKLYVKKYTEENKDKLKDYLKYYRTINKDIILKKRRDRYESNKESELKNQRKFYNENRDIILEKSRKKYNSLENKKELNKRKNDKRKEQRKENYEKNKESILDDRKLYYEKNKESIKKYREDYKPRRNEKRREDYKYKISNDNLFKVSECIRSLIRQSFKNNNYNKNSNTIEILGLTYLEFKEYIESKFESWMTWENKGLYNGELNYGWDVDHIIPISSGRCEDDIVLLNHYTNLQPLCSYVNRVIKRDNW